MSLNGALLTGVSALDANSLALTLTSSNIANVNTIGYKTSNGAFSTFLASTVLPGQVSPAGVQLTSKQDLTQQGLITSTSSATDMAVSGNGFFVVTNNAASPTTQLYTRAGSFAPDANGFLKNASGLYLMGWQLDSSGNLPANLSNLVPVNLASLNQTASATTALNVRANLQASDAANGSYVAGDIFAGNATADFQQTFNVYDSQGGSRPMNVAFAKTGPNTWAYELTYQGTASDIGGAANNPVATGNLTFNSDGTLASPASGTVTATIPWAASTGLASQPISLNFGTVGKADGISQLDTTSSMTSAGVNGAPSGALTGVSVDDQGFVTALFDNGIQQRVFKLPVATFSNPDGLASVSGNAFQISDTSGSANILEAKTGGAGSIASSSLEASTVDLAKEFTDLITTQRAYSAATKIITTADQMMQELLSVKQ